jgi:hypothetical protein
MILGSGVPLAGQTPLPETVRMQAQGAQIMTTQRAVATPMLAPSFLLSPDPGKSPAPFSRLFVGTYESDHGPEYLSPMDEVKTLTLTQSSLPIFQLWGGRLQLGAFQSTVHSQNVPFGPSGYGGMEGFRPTRQSYPGSPLSVHLSGFSLSFHFGRDSRTRPSTHLWRHMTRLVGSVLN